jgi:hypothetical protein
VVQNDTVTPLNYKHCYRAFIIMTEVTIHLSGRDLFSKKYDGYKLDKINLAVATQITKRSELDDLIRSLQILKYTLDEDKCNTCCRTNG